MVAPLAGRQATLGTAQKMPRETAVPPKLRGREIRMPLATNAYSLQSEPLLAGDDGTVQTVRKIRTLVHQGKNDPRINHFVGRLLRAARVASYDRPKEVRAIFDWVVGNIRFMQDPTDAECLRPAATTLEWGFGDCDDINAILLPAMLKTAGHRVRLVTIASHPGAPEQFSHVYCEANVDGRWVPLDAARSGTRFGSAPSRVFRKRVWSLDADTFEDLRGLGCNSCGGACQVRPRRRTMLGTHYRSLAGLGRHYRSSGLGQDGFDWSSFTDVLNAAGKAATNIVTAAKTPGFVYPSAAAYPPYGTYAVPPTVPPGGGVSAVGAVSQNTLIIGGLAVVGLLLVSRRS
jgi:Transglutaminase-like superfamily